MPRYVDGFVIPIPKKNLGAYRKLAALAGKVWMEHGAVQYVECVGDDLSTKQLGAPFPRMTKMKKGETVLYSFIVYKTRAHRDRVNAKVMADKRIAAMFGMKMPFDMKRMAMGGFRALVDLP